MGYIQWARGAILPGGRRGKWRPKPRPDTTPGRLAARPRGICCFGERRGSCGVRNHHTQVVTSRHATLQHLAANHISAGHITPHQLSLQDNDSHHITSQRRTLHHNRSQNVCEPWRPSCMEFRTVANSEFPNIHSMLIFGGHTDTLQPLDVNVNSAQVAHGCGLHHITGQPVARWHPRRSARGPAPSKPHCPPSSMRPPSAPPATFFHDAGPRCRAIKTALPALPHRVRKHALAPEFLDLCAALVAVDPDLVREPLDPGMFDADEDHEPSSHASEECEHPHHPNFPRSPPLAEVDRSRLSLLAALGDFPRTLLRREDDSLEFSV